MTRPCTAQLCAAGTTDVFIVDVAELQHRAFAIIGKSLRTLLEDESVVRFFNSFFNSFFFPFSTSA